MNIADLLTSLMLTLHTLAGYPTLPSPRVEILEPQVLAQEICKDACELQAAYKDGVVYLSSRVDLNTPFGRSVLFHELVHYAQARVVDPATESCQDRTWQEKQAIDWQNEYLSRVEHCNTHAMFMRECRA